MTNIYTPSQLNSQSTNTTPPTLPPTQTTQSNHQELHWHKKKIYCFFFLIFIIKQIKISLFSAAVSLSFFFAFIFFSSSFPVARARCVLNYFSYFSFRVLVVVFFLLSFLRDLNDFTLCNSVIINIIYSKKEREREKKAFFFNGVCDFLFLHIK